MLKHLEQFLTILKPNTDIKLLNKSAENANFFVEVNDLEQKIKNYSTNRIVEKKIFPINAQHEVLKESLYVRKGEKITDKENCIYIIENINTEFMLSSIELLSHNFSKVSLARSFLTNPLTMQCICVCYNNKHTQNNIFGNIVENKINLKKIYKFINCLYNWICLICNDIIKMNTDYNSESNYQHYLLVLSGCFHVNLLDDRFA